MKNQYLRSLILIFLPFFLFAQDSDKEYPDKLSEEFHGLNYRNVGPFRGGRSNTVSGVVDNSFTYYMGTVGGGIFKTDDAGITWKNISDGQLATGSVGAIAVSESDPNVIYAGMGEHAVRGVMTSYGDGVYKSTDAGKTWNHIGLNGTDHISRIRIHPENSDIVYVAAQGTLYGPNDERGIFRSRDGGKNWEKILFIDYATGASDISMDMVNPRILYASMWDHQRSPWQVRSGGPGSGIYKSTDSGDTWERLEKGLPDSIGKVAVDVSRANNQIVYANIEAEKGGVYRSDDAGESWIHICKDRITIARAWYYIEIYADPINEDVVYVMNAPFLKSIDGGKTFKSISVPHGDQHDLWINPDNSKIMINANDGGANISFNGGQSWSKQDNQSTAQFYRVITDNQFPYRLYGGQQDNSTVSILSRTNNRGIGEKDWESSAGGESAFLAFDENNPTRVFGGSYQGNIDYYEPSTRMSKDIMAYPVIGLGTNPKDMKYRFNWNAPIVTDPRDASVLYHGANVVLMSTDDGKSWKEISPDLTRNDTTRHIAGGTPYTNEGAGGENYNTLSYLAVSPHQKGVIYAGSDDGLIHITTDGGSSWNNITPEGLEESLINTLDISAHNPARIIASVTRYKWNEKQPLIYISNDYGKSWVLRTNNIDKEAYVRVVREDPQVENLLYAGTEKGLYVSHDLGVNWYPMQLNLPVSPINDLTFRNNDLVIATSGRGFWILDDLSAIQSSAKGFPKDSIYLFQPKETVKFGYNAPRKAPNGIGQNPLPGVILDYYVPKDSLDIGIKILDKDGVVIREYSNKKDENNPENLVLTNKKGVNRFSWDLRKSNLPKIKGLNLLMGLGGHVVSPGKYSARLISENDSTETSIMLNPYKGTGSSSEDYDKQYTFLNDAESMFRDIHGSVNRMNTVKSQLVNQKASISELDNTETLVIMNDSIVKEIELWLENLIQPKQKTFQDIINFPNQLNAELLDLMGRVDGMYPVVNQGSIIRMEDLKKKWNAYENQRDAILNDLLKQYNQMYIDAKVPIVVVPRE
jgi:photosystem II stability/assembly factor-like uncharacterized protein